MELETKKKSRKVLRSSFTRQANELEVLLNAETPVVESVKVLWELLQSKHEELGILDHAVYDLMLDSAAEAELESEIEARDAYLKKFTTLKVRYEKLFDDAEMAKAESSRSSSTGQGLHINETTGKRKFKLPPLEFKHYDGSIKDWLAFWSQFKKIHEDESIDDHDKIEYLIQATVAGSKARQLVESYPAMSENYQKIISSMLSRFGREDLQIEVYVREVLKLILTNAASQQKMEIATLHDQIETQLRALETLGITSDKCSALLYPLIESCLPHELLRAWQRSASFSKCEPEDVSNGGSTCTLEIRLKKLMAFLKHEVENEQRITLASEGFGLSERKVHAKPSTKKQGDIPTATGLINHEKMSLEQKRNALSGKKACFRCLKPGHQSKKCRGRLKCIVCSRSHATLMCPEISANKKLDDEPPDNNGSNVQEETERDRVLANNTRTQILLQTVRVTLKGIYRSKMVRALFDTGSQRSYVLSETANELGYPPKRAEKVVHCLFGGKELSNAHNCYDVTISNGKHSYTFEALDQPVICNDVAPVSYGPWMKEMADLGIEISDVRDHGPIELLLGADIVGSLYTGLRRELPCGLIAMETHIGWTLMGKIHTRKAHSDLVMTTLNLFVKDASISDLWELEALGIKEPSDKHTKEEMAMAAKDLFYETVKTQPDGRYEWEGEGIIERLGRLGPDEVNQGHYLPHRPVVKESSATTKIRPVYDASAHEKGQPSLNHCLEKGMNLIELIPSMLLRFRENKIGVVSDIKKAFLQIGVNERDRDYLRFLWVDDKGDEVVFCHKRVVFGLNSSPFLLGATLEYHLAQCLKKCNEAEATYGRDTVERLSHSFYVDNCVTSLPNEDFVTRFITEAVDIMAEGHFELRGWERSQNGGPGDVKDPCPVLGINWCPQKDFLMLNQKFLEGGLNTGDIVTKRLILSVTQKVFDPIGYLCPATLIPKLILQNLWKKGLKWDEPVDDTTARSFKRWLEDLPYLSEIRIPRWILMGDSESEELSLHTFCDASKDAYACVVYLRAKRYDKVSVFLLAAKARVAPLKRSTSKMTIPRLELLAATIGARLFTHVNANLGHKIDCYFWSDSSTVVSWIQRKEEWGIFVWNRVAEIRKLTPAEKWRHLPGIHNPADLPSRGCSPGHLLKSRWWEGPEWLRGNAATWPSDKGMYNEEEIGAERKKSWFLRF
ncbi:hypothetical protein NQ318_001099 [Aromia moschata]|uniref:CCHC-type domain-containing protein n=1 Tax=Aromia moschata TaxID=1265417 RepID=A0AAV8ZGX2_9CUCU|nr:hypothetical protein NQ318_001099 [Aromia moschata]